MTIQKHTRTHRIENESKFFHLLSHRGLFVSCNLQTYATHIVVLTLLNAPRGKTVFNLCIKLKQQRTSNNILEITHFFFCLFKYFCLCFLLSSHWFCNRKRLIQKERQSNWASKMWDNFMYSTWIFIECTISIKFLCFAQVVIGSSSIHSRFFFILVNETSKFDKHFERNGCNLQPEFWLDQNILFQSN